MRRTLLVAVSSVGVRSPVPAGLLAATARLVLEAEGAREALLSIALVTNEFRPLTHPGQVATVGAELKAYAKQSDRSVYVKERRKVPEK